MTVSAGPDIADAGASVNVTGHLVPQIDIGLSALGGIVSTTIFLNLDASAGLGLSANADVHHGGNHAAAVAGGAQACVDANAGLAVNIGAQASFFDLFDASTGAELFNKNFPLLQVRARGIHARVVTSLTRFMAAARNALGCLILPSPPRRSPQPTLSVLVMCPTRPPLRARVSHALWHWLYK